MIQIRVKYDQSINWTMRFYSIIRSILIQRMSENNSQYAVVAKQEYLPPPLENNYLSLLDIQAKMAQEFLQGTDQQKITIIKKRIKKFFDYGNDQPNVDVDLTNESNSNGTFPHPHLEVNQNTLIGLQIFTSQVIIYGKDQVNLENAEKLFPGFIGSQKIDDCNLKLIFPNQSDPKKLLKEISKDKGTITIDHIENPSEIQWFEVGLKLKNKDTELTFYVRYATNKDDLLFENDKYFRKLLGKARYLLDKKQEEDQKREIELKEIAQRKASINQRKKYTVKRWEEKPHGQDFDAMTHYDGVYSQRPYQKYESGQGASYNQSFEEPQHLYPGENTWKKHKQALDDLDISEVQDPNFYQQKKYEYNPRKRDFCKSNSRDFSIDFVPVSGHKKRPEVLVENSRDKIIKDYREKSIPKHEKKSRFYESADYDRGYERRFERPRQARQDY